RRRRDRNECRREDFICGRGEAIRRKPPGPGPLLGDGRISRAVTRTPAVSVQLIPDNFKVTSGCTGTAHRACGVGVAVCDHIIHAAEPVAPGFSALRLPTCRRPGLWFSEAINS